MGDGKTHITVIVKYPTVVQGPVTRSGGNRGGTSELEMPVDTDFKLVVLLETVAGITGIPQGDLALLPKVYVS